MCTREREREWVAFLASVLDEMMFEGSKLRMVRDPVHVILLIPQVCARFCVKNSEISVLRSDWFPSNLDFIIF